MAQRKRKALIWSDEALRNLIHIMDFWLDHNKSAAYSLKIKKQIDKVLHEVCLQPNIGKRTDFAGVKAVTKGNYQILYRDLESSVVVLRIWDSRRNPEDLTI